MKDLNKKIDNKKRSSKIWLKGSLFFILVIIIVLYLIWLLYYKTDKVTPVQNVIKENLVEEVLPVNQIENVIEESQTRPACAVIEDILLNNIVADNVTDYEVQFESARIYSILADKGCPENSQFFKGMALRKQTIAEGLQAVYDSSDNTMKSIEYLISDEKICQTIENRVLKNINVKAFFYDDFLNNANTYSVLYQYGCKCNRMAYSRAAVRELAIAMALQPAEHMNKDEIIMVVEVYKRLGVANLAHLVLQRLKARGYDMGFLLELEDIIYGIR